MKKIIPAILLFVLVIISTLYIKSDHSNKLEAREREENEQDGMQEAMEQEFQKTQDPSLHIIPTERLALAAKKVDAMMRQMGASNRSNALSWIERGPNNIGGRTRAILVDANDATGNTIFTGSVGGGIWKCTNFTTASYSWTSVNDQMANLAVVALAQDPSTPNTMYAGTGEGFYNADGIKGGGIFKSTDGGATWAVLPNTVPGTSSNFDYVQDLVVTAAGHIYAATRGSACNTGGILKSTDGGSNWTNVVGTGSGGLCSGYSDFVGSDLEIAANGDLYCTTGLFGTAANTYSRIFKSAASIGANQGNSGQWTNITPTPPSPDLGFRRIELACAPSDNQFLYAMCQSYNGNGLRRCYKSINGGTSWTEITPPSWCDQGSTNTDMTRSQAWYDLIAAYDPNDVTKVFIGGVDVMKSTDGGSTFAQLTQWASGCASLPFVHADNHNIVFLNGSSNKMLLANDGGIFYTNDGGATFVTKNNGYNITQYYGLAMHPSTTNYFIAGAQDNGTHIITSSGIGSGTTFSGGDGAICHISQTNPSIVIGAYTRDYVVVSRDGGATYAANGVGNGYGQFINPSDYDARTGILYQGHATGYLGRTINISSGTVTANFNQVTALGSTSITALKVDPNANNTVFVGGSGSTSTVPVILKLTNTSSGTPTATNISIAAAVAGSYVSSIDIEKGNSNHLLVTFSNYGVTSVYESINGGTTWTAIEGTLPDMPVRWGIFLPAGSNEGVIALATELGVFTTTATSGGTTTWISNNSGFPKVRTDMLKYRPSDNTLAAATHGRGIFTTTIGITPVTWNGSSSNAWTIPTNWTPNRVPGITDEVVIPKVTTLPEVSTTQSLNKITINNLASVSISGSLQVAGNLINNGTITGSGTITMSGFAGQTISGTGSIKNLSISNDVTVTSGVGNNQSIAGLLSVSAGTLTTNGNIILKSTSITNTALVGTISGTISGNVTIERYVPASNRSFRLLSAGVNTTSSINANWQEGANNLLLPFGNNINPNPGYGTHITGSTTGANGFDATATGAASMYTFSNSTQSWIPVGNTNVNVLNTQTGYRILVRGDRSTNLTTNTPTVTPTTLRATGTLTTGNSAVAGLATAINQYSFVSNPYWAPVDWTLLQPAAANLTSTYFIWDPTIAGTNSRGGYTSFTRTGAGTGTVSGGGAINKNIQPGQAFFVQNSAASPTLTFLETYKDLATALTNTFRTTGNNSGTDGVVSIKLFLKDNFDKNLAADGVSFAFRSDFKNTFDAFDAEKIANPDESISFKSTKKLLGFEARNLPTEADTMFLNMGNMLSKNYVLQIDGTDFSSNIVQAYLYDKYLKKRTYINLTGTVTVNYDIDKNSASAAADRFIIVLGKGNTSIPLQSNNLQLTVTPNPAKDHILVSFTSQEKSLVNMNIVNVNGQIVQKLNLGNLQNAQEYISIDKLPTGIYTLTLYTNNEKQTVKFIKL